MENLDKIIPVNVISGKLHYSFALSIFDRVGVIVRVMVRFVQVVQSLRDLKQFAIGKLTIVCELTSSLFD